MIFQGVPSPSCACCSPGAKGINITADALMDSCTLMGPNSSPVNFTRRLPGGQSLLAWSVWGGCFGLAFHAVWRGAANVPFYDDWMFVPYLTGEQPLTWDWLWAVHNEHRLPVPKLIIAFILHVTQGGFFAATFPVVLAAGALAAVFMLLARRLRGRTRWTDSLFPLVFLNLAHCENFFTPFQISFTGAVLTTGLLLAGLLWSPQAVTTYRRLLFLAGCALLACGFGPASLVYVPAVACWLLYSAQLLWRSTEPRNRRFAVVTGSIALGLLVLTSLIWAGALPAERDAPRVPLLAGLRVGLQFLATGISPLLQLGWPLSSGISPLFLLGSGLLLLFRIVQDASNRSRGAALLLFLCALLALAGGIGVNRAALSETAGWSTRYAILSALAWVITFFSILLFDRNEIRREFLLGLLCVGALLLYSRGGQFRDALLATRTAILQDFERDVRAGLPTSLLVDRYTYPPDNPRGQMVNQEPFWTAKWLLDLRTHRIGIFQPVSGEEHIRWEFLHLSIAAISSTNIDWDQTASAGRMRSETGDVRISFPKEEYVQRVYLQLATYGVKPQPVPVEIQGLTAEGRVVPDWSRREVLRGAPWLKIPVDRRIAGLLFRFGKEVRAFQVQHVSLLAGIPGDP